MILQQKVASAEQEVIDMWNYYEEEKEDIWEFMQERGFAAPDREAFEQGVTLESPHGMSHFSDLITFLNQNRMRDIIDYEQIKSTNHLL